MRWSENQLWQREYNLSNQLDKKRQQCGLLSSGEEDAMYRHSKLDFKTTESSQHIDHTIKNWLLDYV